MGPPSPPRRITRGALARYAYQASTQIYPDIEDAIPSSCRKRKRKDSVNSLLTSRPRRTRHRPDPELDAKLESETDSTIAPATTPSQKRANGLKTDTNSKNSDNTSITRARSTRIKTAIIESEFASASTARAPKSFRKARKPARRVKNEEGEVKVKPPSNWQEMYELVKEMRLGDGPAANAPVDTMGCERLAERRASPRDRRFQTLIALMLSSQTKDTVNAVVMKRLQTELEPHVPGAKAGLNLENVLAVEPTRLNELIGLVGFHNNKTKYIKQAASILRDQFGGDIPDTIEGLISLPGVGPKMAHLCLSAAWNRTEGIGVDVHVHRISNLWGWNTTKTPEETRAALQSWLPKDKWREINWLLVGFGQMVCTPVARKCGQCELGLQGLCKAADRKKVNDARSFRAQMATVDKEIIQRERHNPAAKHEITVEENMKVEATHASMGDAQNLSQINHKISSVSTPTVTKANTPKIAPRSSAALKQSMDEELEDVSGHSIKEDATMQEPMKIEQGPGILADQTEGLRSPNRHIKEESERPELANVPVSGAPTKEESRPEDEIRPTIEHPDFMPSSLVQTDTNSSVMREPNIKRESTIKREVDQLKRELTEQIVLRQRTGNSRSIATATREVSIQIKRESTISEQQIGWIKRRSSSIALDSRSIKRESATSEVPIKEEV